MIIPFDMGYVFRPDSNSVDDSQALEALLELMVLLNRRFLRRYGGTVPSLYRSGVRYGRTQEWLPLPMLLRYKVGDCKSLATARAAELREQGIPVMMVHRWLIRRDGGKDFHILLMVKDAGGVPKVFEDPSKVCGMGDDENAGSGPYFGRDPGGSFQNYYVAA
jgi:hypothetical protein